MEKPTPCVPAEGGEGGEEEQEKKPEEPTESPSVPTSLPINGEVEGGSQLPWPEPITPGTRAKVHWRRTIDKTIEHNRSESQELEEEEEEEGGVELRNLRTSQRPSNLNLEDTPRKSLFMREGDGHRVWKPKRKRPQLYNVVKDVMRQRTLSETSEEPEPEPQPEKPVPEEKKKKSLWERQRTLAHRLKVTQLVFKEQNEELVNEDSQPKHLSLRDASRRISENLKQQKSDSLHFPDIVSLYLEQQHSTEQQENGDPPKPESAGPIPSPVKPRRPKATTETPGVVPLQKWRQICRQQNQLGRAKTAFNFRNIPVYEEKEKTSKEQQHPPADRTRSEQGMARVSHGRSPMLKSQSAIRRTHMQKQANVADWTDSGDVTLMDMRTREERFFDLVQDQRDEYNSLQQSGTLPQTQQNGKLSKTSINGERPTSVPVEIGSMTSSESLLAQGSTKTFEWPSSAKPSTAADKQTLTPERPSSAKSSAADKERTPERPSSAKSSTAADKERTPERPSSAKSSAAANKQRTPERPSSAKSSTAANKQRTPERPSSAKSSAAADKQRTPERPSSAKSSASASLSPERPSSAKSSKSNFFAAEQPSQALSGVGLFAEDSKIHVSPSSNRVKLTPTHRRPPMPLKEAFTAPKQQRKSEVSLKSDTGSESHRRRSVSPDLDVSTFV